MFARKVSARLQPNSLARFAHLMETEVLTWLKEQQGFLDLVTLAAPDGREVAVISFWDYPASAEAYHASVCPTALNILGELLDGTPYVKNFEVLGSTVQRLAARKLPADRVPAMSSPRLGYQPLGATI
jgi:hypothetical protein